MTRWLVVASVLVLAVVGVVAVVVTQGGPSHSATPDAMALTSSARHQFADVGELVGASDLVVVGRVIADEDGRTFGDGTPVRVDGMRRGRIGDRAVWFLTASTDPDFPAYALVNAQGRYLFARSGVRGGDGNDALVRSMERLRPNQLQDAVIAATTSISR